MFVRSEGYCRESEIDMCVMFIWEGELFYDVLVCLTYEQDIFEYIIDQDGQISIDLFVIDVFVRVCVDVEKDMWLE